MALNDITFIEGQGGLGRPLPGSDFISGLVLYGSYPSGFSSPNNIQKVFSLTQAEALGITDDSIDEIPAVFSTTLTPGTTGNTINFTATLPAQTFGGTPTVINVATYTQAAGDTTATILATSIATLINSGTSGFTATTTTGTLKISFPKGYGLTVNAAGQLTITVSGTLSATTPTVTAATPSTFVHWHYQISEYFRLQPQGVLYVGVFPTPGGSYTFTEIQTVQTFSQGTIRQFGVYEDAVTSAANLSAHTTTIEAVQDAAAALHMPFSVLYSANIKALTLSTLVDLSANSNKKVSVVISQDGGNEGALLFQQLGKSIPTLGAALGAVSLAAVSQSIAWVQNFNISNGQENATIAFATGDLYSSVASTLVSTLNSYRYIFLRPFIGISGSYFNDSHCAISYTSDYAYIENNRTIDKAIRVVYAGVLPYLNGPLTLNADGTLANITIAYVEDQLVNPELDQMVRDGDLSAYSVTIDPTQNVLSTSKLVIAVKLISKGVARNIVVNIGYAQSL